MGISLACEGSQRPNHQLLPLFEPFLLSLTLTILVGQIIATPGALETLARANQTPDELLVRHPSGEWELQAPDLAGNMNNLKQGFSVRSTYRSPIDSWTLPEPAWA